MRTAHELGIRTVEVPLIHHITTALGRVALKLNQPPLQHYFGGLIGILLLVLISSRFWSVTGDVVFYVVLVALMAVLLWVLNFLNKVTSSTYVRFMFGSPVLGDLGTSLPRGILFTGLRAAREVQFTFDAAGLELVRDFLQLDRDVTSETVKLAFRDHHINQVIENHWLDEDGAEWVAAGFLEDIGKIVRVPEDVTAESIQALAPHEVLQTVLRQDEDGLPNVELTQEFEAAWDQFWQSVLEIRSGTQTYADALDTDDVSSRVTIPLIAGVTSVLIPFLMLAQLAVITAMVFHLHGEFALVTVIQIGALVTAMIVITYSIHHIYTLTELPFRFIYVAPEARRTFGERIDAFAGVKVAPSGPIHVGKNYLPIVRDYLIRVTPLTFLTSFNMIILAGLCAGLGAVWFSGESRFVPWYRDLVIGLLLIPVGFTAGAWVMFWFLQNFKLLVAPILIGLIAITSPYVISYMTGGMELERTVEQVVAGLSTAGVLATTALSSFLMNRMEQGGKAPAQG